MKTYTQLRNLYGKWTKNTTSDNLTQGDIYNNDSIRTICNLQGGKLRFLEAIKDMYTVVNQESYQIPNGFRKLIDLSIYSGSGASNPNSDTIYSPEMIFDPTKWKLILQYRLGTASTPYYTYVENQKFLIQPIPSVTGNLIRLRGRLQVKDLSIADVTNITVTNIANGGTDMIVSGGMTADFVGRYIRITETTAANGGDGFWYQIGTYTSATQIGLLKPYEGTSIAAGTAASTIGQCSVIPEAYDAAIAYRSTALYWQNNDDLVRSKFYWTLYDGGNEAGYSDVYGGLIGQMLANEGETEEGSYLPPYNSSSNLPNAPYYFPYQQASGF